MQASYPGKTQNDLNLIFLFWVNQELFSLLICPLNLLILLDC